MSKLYTYYNDSTNRFEHGTIQTGTPNALNVRYVFGGLTGLTAPYYSTIAAALSGADSSTHILVYPYNYGNVTITQSANLYCMDGVIFNNFQVGSGTTYGTLYCHIAGKAVFDNITLHKTGSSVTLNLIECKKITNALILDYGSYANVRTLTIGNISCPNAGNSVCSIELETANANNITLSNANFKLFINGKSGALKLTNAYGYIEASESGQITVDNGSASPPTEYYDVHLNIRKVYTATTADGTYGVWIKNNSRVLLRSCRLIVASDVNVALLLSNSGRLSLLDCYVKAQKTTGYAFSYSDTASFHARDCEFVNTLGASILVGNSVANGMFNCAIKAASGYNSFVGSGTVWLMRCVGDRAIGAGVTGAGDYYVGMMDSIL